MKKILLPFVAMVMAFGLFSCNKAMDSLPAEYINVNPKILETHGGKVAASITGTFPEKFFVKKAILSVTPVLKYEGGEARGETVSYQGEKVKDQNFKVVSYKEGGQFTQNISFDYVPEMRNSQLVLEFVVKTKKKEMELPDVKIADGVIATPTLVKAVAIKPAFGQDKFIRVIQETQEADLMFLIQQANIRSSEISKDEVKAVKDAIASTKEDESRAINSLAVSAYASPDGPESLNANLAEKREKAAVDFFKKQFGKKEAQPSVNSKFTAEDWDGFRALVMNSDIQDKEMILRVLSMYQDPLEREKEIKNMSAAYKALADEILPQLRCSKLQVVVDVIGRSDEEILDLLKNDASKLSVEETIYAGAIAKDDDTKVKAYEAAMKNYPEDWRGYNNAGAMKFMAGDVKGAQELFNQAFVKQANPETNFNLGLVELANGNDATAEEYFGRAAGVGDKLNEAMAVLYVKQGKYKDAAGIIGNVKSNNAGIVYIMNGDLNTAQSTLTAIENPDAMTHYILAIVGARANDKDLLIANLKKAVEMDKDLAKFALTDLEFYSYLADADFLAIAK
ncbi:MAG: hypothetical protein IJ270_03230 [Paludibacteraceae bacterium]|nr:hypothetical protein [Paludibacteraceae bacterium]